ncbi:MAG TPA: hypothetical protein VFI42_12895 [Thermomicrobiaceae bacterium]|nr:hypothetical protein [Thermomicrobiaceae bacterium]
MTYAEFRTGLRYRDVYHMLWSGSDDPRDWRYKRRHTVLGFWHQIKLQLWQQYLDASEGSVDRAGGSDADTEGDRAADGNAEEAGGSVRVVVPEDGARGPAQDRTPARINQRSRRMRKAA